MTVPLPTPAEVEGMRARLHDATHGDDISTWYRTPWGDIHRLLALVEVRDKIAATNRTFTAAVERDRDEARARLNAVLAECDAIEKAAKGWSGSRAAEATAAARIRRAATGEA